MSLFAWFKRSDKPGGSEQVTGTVSNEGQANEKRAVDVNVVDGISVNGDVVFDESTLAKDYKLATNDFTQANLDGSNNLAVGMNVDAVAVSNDGTADITVTILTKTHIIKPGEIRELNSATGQFNTVGFSAGSIFRCAGLVA